MSALRCPHCNGILLLYGDAQAPDKPLIPQHIAKLLEMPFNMADLSVRVRHLLLSGGQDIPEGSIKTVADMIAVPINSMLVLRNFGRTSLSEVRAFILSNGLIEYAHPSWKQA